MMKTLYAPLTIEKKDNDVFVSGLISSEAVDSQGDVVRKDAIKEAWDDYMKFANIREMHEAKAAGVTVEYEHKDDGTWIKAKVVDPIAKIKVLEEVYKGFSIGGKILKKTKNIIEKLKLFEVSLVDRPANPDAIFTMSKIDMAKDADGNEPEELDEEKKEEEIEKARRKKEEEPIKEEPKKEEPKVVVEPPKEKPTCENTVLNGGNDPVTVANDIHKVFEVKKGASEVIMLSDLLAHCKFLKDCFMGDEDKEPMMKSLEEVCDMILNIIKKQAVSEKNMTTEDLNKVFTPQFDALSKAVSSINEKLSKVEELAKEVSSLKERVVKVEEQPAGDKPAINGVKEKEFAQVGEPEPKKEELEEVKKEIDSFYSESRALVDNPNPDRERVLKMKGEQLFAKYAKLSKQSRIVNLN